MKNLLVLILVLVITSMPTEAIIFRIIDNGDGTVGILNSAYTGINDDMYYCLTTDIAPYPSGGYVTGCAPAATSVIDDAVGVGGIPLPPGHNGVWGYIGDPFGSPKPACVSINGINAPIGARVQLWCIPGGYEPWVLDELIVSSTPNDCLNSTAPEYPDWFFLNKPPCWCYARQCRGDINGKKTMVYWVQLLDLQLMAKAYNKTDAELALISGGICADINHKKTAPYRVQLLDLQELAKYYNKVEALVPKCDQETITTGPYNFWTEPPP